MESVLFFPRAKKWSCPCACLSVHLSVINRSEGWTIWYTVQPSERWLTGTQTDRLDQFYTLNHLCRREFFYTMSVWAPQRTLLFILLLVLRCFSITNYIRSDTCEGVLYSLAFLPLTASLMTPKNAFIKKIISTIMYMLSIAMYNHHENLNKSQSHGLFLQMVEYDAWHIILHSPEEVASDPRILCWVMFFPYLGLASLNRLVL